MAETTPPPIHVEVVYALPREQVNLPVELTPPVTAGEAIRASGVLERFPEIDLRTQRLGVFSRVVAPDQPLVDGDRVEIYRPLRVDPKEMRRRRATGSGPR